MTSFPHGFWHDTAVAQRHPALTGDVRADVAVVGAGVTGLSTALLLAGAGADVVVVEAARVAAGVTGLSTAKVTSQHSLLYSQIASAHGEDVARVYATANQAAVEQVAVFVDAGGIDCDLSRRPACTYTLDESTVGAIGDEVALCQRLGLPASFTTDVDLPFDVLGAVCFDDQLQLHPVAYCDGLARILLAAGGRVFEQSRVTGVDDGDPAVVTVEAGSVTADAVVLATQIPILDRGALFAKVEPSASAALAVETAGPLPLGMHISADSPTRSVRSVTADGRDYLVVVGEDHRTGSGDEAAAQQRLEEWATRHWPDARVTAVWTAEDFSPQDHLPFIGPLSRTTQALFTATGFQKWGLSNGTAAALVLSELVRGRSHPWAEVFDPSRLTPRASASSFVEHNVTAAVRMIGDRIRSRGLDAVAALTPGEGVVVGSGGRHYAVSRDDDGSITSLSATCTHLGCLVAFNATDRTWDCPCHGSRFAADGSVVSGPAVDPLESADIPDA